MDVTASSSKELNDLTTVDTSKFIVLNSTTCSSVLSRSLYLFMSKAASDKRTFEFEILHILKNILSLKITCRLVQWFTFFRGYKRYKVFVKGQLHFTDIFGFIEF